jgi:RNA-directed DNA polymerase
LSDISAHPCAFGFSGGSIVDAINPHLGSKIILSFDVVNAFDHITRDDVLYSLLDGRWTDYRGKPVRYGALSWYSAHVVADISTWLDKLPQGAPTSPRLFDQAFKGIDAHLFALAQKFGGVFTRYADNIFFSLKDRDYFPPKLERAVLRAVGNKYQWHKRSVRTMTGGTIRMLGLNVLDGKITAPRDYKRRLRLAVHHVQYLLDHDLPFEEAWVRLQGQMAFGSLGTLPDGLTKAFADLEMQIEKV